MPVQLEIVQLRYTDMATLKAELDKIFPNRDWSVEVSFLSLGRARSMAGLLTGTATVRNGKISFHLTS